MAEICDQYWPYVRGCDKLRSDDAISDRFDKLPGVASFRDQLIQASGEVSPAYPKLLREQALEGLQKFGIAFPEAQDFADRIDPDRILDTIDYVSWLASEKGTRVRHKQSLLVYYLRESVPLPSDFLTTRQRAKNHEAELKRAAALASTMMLESDYADFCSKAVEAELENRYPGATLIEKLNQISAPLKNLPQFRRISSKYQPDIWRQILRKEIRASLDLPSFEEWSKNNG